MSGLVSKMGPMQGPDLSGSMRRKFWAYHGLKEPGGAALAGVQGMGDITQFDKKGLNWGKIMMGIGTGAMNPWIGSRILSDTLSGGGKGGGVAKGIFGAGGAMGFAEFYIGFKIFEKAVQTFKATIDNAAKIYANALQNGMGLKWSTKRSLLAEIMGVSEQDVFRFGKQMAYLNSKLEFSAGILSKTAVPLTQVSWEFKLLGNDLKALFAQIATDVSPAVLTLTRSLEGLVIGLTLAAKAANTKVNGIPITGLGQINWFLEKLNNKMGGAMPSPQSWMKQLPASHWEHMGLVTMGNSGNPARETANNTKSAAVSLKKLVQYFGKNSGGKDSWGSSQLVNCR